MPRSRHTPAKSGHGGTTTIIPTSSRGAVAAPRTPKSPAAAQTKRKSTGSSPPKSKSKSKRSGSNKVAVSGDLDARRRMALRDLWQQYKLFDGKLMIPKLSFARVWRNLMQAVADEIQPDRRWQAQAIALLQEQTENYITRLLTDALECAHHAKRVTVMARDIHLTLRLYERNPSGRPGVTHF
ncbi:hypothetical protein Pelo_11503 [Pelomyxa schiedti]|nr:hypothetical protein Pelo_11503 [Pelomyxa schiedti]